MPETLVGMLVKTSLVDYPGKIAAAVFLQGCNLRCPYCYNADLVTGALPPGEGVTASQIIAHLEKRKNVLSGFVLSGGEPLLSPVAAELISAARSLGYAVKLDTNGMLPDKLRDCIDSPDMRPDFIALDVKTASSRYGILSPIHAELGPAILRSILLVSGLPPESREFRTVLVPGLIADKDILEIAQALPKDAAWEFAPFKPGTCLDQTYNTLSPYSDQEMRCLVDYAKTIIPGAELR
jgi:pyruvate formate lyase activating enzyme